MKPFPNSHFAFTTPPQRYMETCPPLAHRHLQSDDHKLVLFPIPFQFGLRFPCDGMVSAMQLARKPPAFPAIDIRPRPPPPEESIAAERREIGSEKSTELPKFIDTATVEASRNHAHADLLDARRQSPPRDANVPQNSPPTKRVRVSNVKSGRTTRRHQCSICSQCYARAEHLSRHERSRELLRLS